MIDYLRRIFFWKRAESSPVESELTFDELQRSIYLRSLDVHPASHRWTEMEWGCALAGETGELCNYLKKWNRDGGSPQLREEIAKELGDIVGYANSVANYFGLRLGACVQNKFNEVSHRLHVWDFYHLGEEHVDVETSAVLPEIEAKATKTW